MDTESDKMNFQQYPVYQSGYQAGYSAGIGSIFNPGLRWIKCSDRLPEKDGRYLVTEGWESGDKWVGVCSLRQGRWDSRLIVAWQELPEPYKSDV